MELEKQNAGDAGQEKSSTNPPCSEFFDFLKRNKLNLNSKIERILAGDSPCIPRFGNAFSLGAGYVLRRAVLRESLPFSLLGKSPNEIEKEIKEMTREPQELPFSISGSRPLSPEEMDQMISMEMAEVEEMAIRGIANSSPPNFNWRGAEMLYGFIREAFYPSEEDEKQLTLPLLLPRESGIVWASCRDTDYYLAASLLETNQRKKNGASALIYYDEEKRPVILQRTGQYKMNNGSKYSESVAVNLESMVVNGVYLPPGILMGVLTEVSGGEMVRIIDSTDDNVLSIKKIKGIFPIRPTIFAINPDQQEATFGSHYQAFKEAFMDWNPRVDLPSMEDFRRTAGEILIKRGIAETPR